MGDPVGHHVDVSVESGVATIAINRPEHRNAFTEPMFDEMIAALDATDADPDVRAVVLTGRGDAFCVGADLSGGTRTFDYGARGAGVEADGRHRDEGGLLTLRLFRSTKPLIAAINGAAAGVGATMTLPADFRLASSQARFGFVFTRRGLVPDGCASWFLPRVVGISTAIDWCVTGRVFDADEAFERGLVQRVYPPDELLPAARSLADQVATHASPVSVSLTRALLWRMLGASHPMDAHRVDSALIESLGSGPDVREGVVSFLEKRTPAFSGRVPDDLPEHFPWWEEPEF